MKSLRVSFVLTGMLLLSASTLQAQASKISCKDGSKPKVGHFSCWGHGGLVTGAVKKDKAASKADKTAEKKAESNVVQAGKPKAEKKKTHAKKAHAKKAHTKKSAKKSKK
jgi:hypothetical protein